jgi:hypothetical protein
MIDSVSDRHLERHMQALFSTPYLNAVHTPERGLRCFGVCRDPYMCCACDLGKRRTQCATLLLVLQSAYSNHSNNSTAMILLQPEDMQCAHTPGGGLGSFGFRLGFGFSAATASPFAAAAPFATAAASPFAGCASASAAAAAAAAFLGLNKAQR